jgi:hypothetical protein
MHVLRNWICWLFLVPICTSFLTSAAQERLSDKDVEATMKNLKEDSKKFRKTFDSAVEKSTIRKTSQEKEAKGLSQQFEKQTEAMLNQFKDKKKADAGLAAVMNTSEQLQKTIETAGISSQVTTDWARVQTSLDALAKEFNVAKAAAPAAAPAAPAAAPK